jgi:Glycosyltransferase family 87
VSRKRFLTAAVWVGASALVLAWFLDRANRPNFSDFGVYWVAGGKAALHQTVYDVQGHYQFKYSPFIALLWAIPRALLPGTRYQWAWLYYAANALGFYSLWYLIARALEPRRAAHMWLLLVVVFSVGLRDELKLGQANLWPFLFVLPGWFVGARPATRATRIDWTELAIGAALSLAIQWKLYALVLAPVWLLRGRWQVWVGALLATFLSLYAALALAHGSAFALAENLRWLQSLTASSEFLLVSQYNVSALGILGKVARHFGGSLGLWAYLIWALLAIAWFAVLVWAERQAKLRAAAFLYFWSASWAWAGIVVLNPLVWPYWLIFCVPLFLAYVTEATAAGVRAAPVSSWVVCLCFAAANWAQNYPVVHAGASLIAVLLLLVDAQRRARARDDVQLARVCEMPLTLPLLPRSS